VQNGAWRERNGRAHARERVARSRRPWRVHDHVRARAAEGLWPAWSAGDGWAAWAVLQECSSTAAAASLLSKLGHQWRAPGRRRRERGREVRCRVGVACRWGHGASPGWQLVADWGVEEWQGEIEGVGRSWEDCLGSHPSLVSTSYRTRRIRGGERRVAS
jgi:hypothetical protein